MKKPIKKFLVILSSYAIGCVAVLCALFSLSGCEEKNSDKKDMLNVDVSFSVSEKNLIIGDEEYLFPTYQKIDGFALSYQSDNPTVVSVNNDGKISAEREGSATVKAIYSNGTKKAEASLLVKSSFGGYLPAVRHGCIR